MSEEAGTTPSGAPSPGKPARAKKAPAKKSGCKTLLIILAVMFGGIMASGILMALFLPALARSLRRARIVNCGSNLSQLWKMENIYMSIHGGRMKLYPPETGSEFWLKLNALDPPLLEDSAIDIYFCPASGNTPTKGSTDYRGPRLDIQQLGDGDYIGGDADINNWHDPGSSVPSGMFLRKSSDVIELEGAEATSAHGAIIP